MMLSLFQPLANHLWQSTAFAALAGLLTLALRNIPARVRYGLWLAASIKFLVPFAILIGLGIHLAPHTATPAAPPGFSVAIQRVSEPFVVSLSPAAIPAPHAWNFSLLPLVLCGIWALGFAIIACSWWLRWLRLRAVVRSASPLHLPLAIKATMSPAFGEPGVFGIRRPVLLLPEGIIERLTPAQFDAILAHELCHVDHRDNLMTALHMAVEAVFWFHPVVWWIGARLMEERERACDEEVLRTGSNAEVYAEGILRICELCLEPPLRCVAGVTGGNLKRRIEQIMNARDVPGLSFAKKAALTMAGVAVLVAPVIVGIANAPAILAQSPPAVPQWQAAAGGQMAFEVASVRPSQPGSRPPLPNFPLDNGDAFKNPRSGESPQGRFSAAFPLPVYISFAYKLSPDQVQPMMAHLPKWAGTDMFEIVAKAPGNPTKDQMRLMMQSLLVERFHLAAHYETQEIPVFALLPIKPGTRGPKLILHSDGPSCEASAPAPPGRSTAGNADDDVFPRVCDVQALVRNKYGRMVTGSRNTTMALLAASLSGQMGRPVVDRSGFTDRIDYRLEWTPESNVPVPPGADVEPDPQPLTFVDALREQLGLKLESTKASVQSLVIDRVEPPSEN